MKTFITFLLFLPIFLFINCKKDEIPGCTDPNSLNYNANATLDEGCEYSSMIFYSSESEYFDIEIDSIVLYLSYNLFPNTIPGDEYIGTIYTFNVETPEDCDIDNYPSYSFESSDTLHIHATLYGDNGTPFIGLVRHVFPDYSKPCLAKDIFQ
jgi:hypothetical protein